MSKSRLRPAEWGFILTKTIISGCIVERNQTTITAYHEAGHAVIAMANGFAVTEIVNFSDVRGHGYVSFQHPPLLSTIDRVRMVTVYAAGAAADYVHWSRECTKLGSSEGGDELCEGNIGDQRDAEEHLIALGDSGRFWDYFAVALFLLKKPEIWPFVKCLGELMRITPRLDGQEVLQRAFAKIPKINEGEIELLREHLVLKQPGFDA